MTVLNWGPFEDELLPNPVEDRLLEAASQFPCDDDDDESLIVDSRFEGTSDPRFDSGAKAELVDDCTDA